MAEARARAAEVKHEAVTFAVGESISLSDDNGDKKDASKDKSKKGSSKTDSQDQATTRQARTQKVGFSAGLVTRLLEQRRKGAYCDIRLKVGTQEVRAHRILLSAYSSYFGTMFTSDFSEKGKDVIDLSDMLSSHEALEALVDYMYTGLITITVDTLDDILNGATLFMLEDLKQRCATFMAREIDPVTCIRWWALADIYGLEGMFPICKDMAKSRFHDFIQHREEILQTTGKFMKKLMDEGVLDLLSPQETFALLERWLDHEPEVRSSDCALLITQYVRCLKKSKKLDVAVDLTQLTKASVSHDSVRKVLSSIRKYFQSLAKSRVLAKDENVFVGTSYTKDAGSLTNAIRIDMHIFRPILDRWSVKKLTISVEKRASSFLGCTPSQFVFLAQERESTITSPKIKTGRQLVLYDFMTNNVEITPDPVEGIRKERMPATERVAKDHSGYKDILIPTYITYSKCVLCILGAGAIEADDWKIPRWILAFHQHSRKWEVIGEAPFCREVPRYEWIEHKGIVYVLSIEKMSIDWFSISGTADKMKVVHLAKPPHDGNDVMWYLHVQEEGDQIRADWGPGDWAYIAYSISTDTWSVRKRQPMDIFVPRHIQKYLKNYLTPDLREDTKHESRLYLLHMVTPYTSHFWSADLAKILELAVDIDKEKEKAKEREKQMEKERERDRGGSLIRAMFMEWEREDRQRGMGGARGRDRRHREMEWEMAGRHRDMDMDMDMYMELEWERDRYESKARGRGKGKEESRQGEELWKSWTQHTPPADELSCLIACRMATAALSAFDEASFRDLKEDFGRQGSG